MRANTIRLDENLLNEIYPLLAPKQSLASYVREVLQKEIRRHTMLQAGRTFVNFLAGNQEEQQLLDSWEKVDLAKPVRRKRTKRQSL